MEQKSRANWLNTENARCHRTVYITKQNVTSKLQIGLSPEMGWYPVSFTIIVDKDVWMCTPGRCSWALFKNCLRPLCFSLQSWCLKSFLFWRLSIRYRSCFFHSCIFHSRIFSAPLTDNSQMPIKQPNSQTRDIKIYKKLVRTWRWLRYKMAKKYCQKFQPRVTDDRRICDSKDPNVT